MARKKKYDDLQTAARERFGYEELRPGQEETIRSVLDRRDTLVVRPTGSGKSAIYQLAALFLDGPTIVISPLIALQKDQSDAIQQNEQLPDAVVLNSHLKAAERREALSKIEQGDLEFLFLAPEQLAKEETIERIKAAQPSLFVVDEAHCISDWGHDFRPDYLRLGAMIDELGHPVTLAITATASEEVRQEIVNRLHMRDPQIFVHGFDRPNLFLSARVFQTEDEKRDALLRAIDYAEKPGIVYCATRGHAEQIAGLLNEAGTEALFYHGGMKVNERKHMHERYMASDTAVVVATNAFGMGVDKPNVRFVYHYDPADSLDSYYQEIGRAGRDGEPAEATLFYREQDLGVRKFLSGSGQLGTHEIEQVARLVADAGGDVTAKDIQEQTNLSGRKVAKVIGQLQDQGVVAESAAGEVRIADESADLQEAAQSAAGEVAKQKENERLRIEQMRQYAELTSCRREYLLSHFGEQAPAQCKRCDNCHEGRTARTLQSRQAAAAPAPPAAAAAPAFRPLSRVEHSQFGRGTVREIKGGKIKIFFDQGGEKTLDLRTLQENGLLKAVA